MEKQKSIINRVSSLLLSILFLGTVSVFAGNVFVSESGIQAAYSSESGNVGATFNLSIVGADGLNYTLVYENGLVVSEPINESGVPSGSSNVSWWNSNWDLRKDITITETSGTTLYNYSVLLNVTKEPEMNPEFSDLIFTFNNFSIPYWIENYNDGAGLPYSEFDVGLLNGLISSYNFDTDATDEHGINDGTVYGGMIPTTGNGGIMGEAYDFDGNDYIDTNTFFPTGENTFGFEFWMKTSSFQHGALYYNPSSGSATIETRMETDGTLFTYFRDDSGNDLLFQTTKTVNDGNWHYISVMKDTATTGKIYIDGILSASDTQAGMGTMTLSGGNSLHVGGRTTSSLTFIGTIDEFRIYDRALTQTEILKKYNAQSVDVYVKVPELSASSDTNISMYYNNSVAISQSDIGNAFLYYDDYTDSSKWTTTEGSWSIGNGILRPLSSGTARVYNNEYSMVGDVSIETRIRNPSSTSSLVNSLVAYSNTLGNAGFGSGWHNSLSGWESGTYPTPDANGKLGISRIDIQGESQGQSYFDDVMIRNTSFTSQGDKIAYISWGQHADMTSEDYLTVKSYASSEPTVLFGAEQSQ